MTRSYLHHIQYNWKAGLTVAFISVPLSIALSIASGAGPIPGLITGIWATLIASFFCSNNYNIIGAAGALTTVLFAATLEAPFSLGAAILPLLAITTGILILAIWFFKLDQFLYYIPSSVMYGFAGGVAFLIAASQLFDAAGLSGLKRTGSFLGDITLFAKHTGDVHAPTLIVFAVTLVGILLWKKFLTHIPAIIPASILGILFGYLEAQFFPLNLVSLGDKFGSIAGALYAPVAWSALPSFLLEKEALTWILKVAGIITLIAVLETLITAKIADKITRTQSSSSTELFGLGLANLGSGVMGGLPATGVFIRTGANIKAGATHKTAATIAAVATGIIALIVLPFFSFIPMAVIAACLVNTAIGLIEIEKFKEFWVHEKASFVIALIVVMITIFEDAGIAVVVGAVLALLWFADKISRGRFDAIFNFADGTKQDIRGEKVLHIPTEKDITVLTYSIAGFLGYIDSARHAANLRHVSHAPKVKNVIIRLRDLFSLDFEGLEMLDETIAHLEHSGKRVCITSASATIKEQCGHMPALAGIIARGDIYAKTSDALARLRA